MKKIIKHLRRIEQGAYPKPYRMMNAMRVSSWRDLSNYCEGRPVVEAWEDGYAIWTEDEVVDIASLSPVPLARLRTVLRKMAKTFGSRAINADCREGTSYKLVQAAARWGLIEVLGDKPYWWAEEKFHSMKLRFNATGRR